MQLAHGTIVAVIDGEILHMYRNSGTEADLKLVAVETQTPSGDNKSAGSRHHSSSADPDESRLEEDSFAAATAAMLNTEALESKFKAIVIIAAPKTLGELRKHWHRVLAGKITAEVAKDLTGHSIKQIETALLKHQE